MLKLSVFFVGTLSLVWLATLPESRAQSPDRATVVDRVCSPSEPAAGVCPRGLTYHCTRHAYYTGEGRSVGWSRTCGCWGRPPDARFVWPVEDRARFCAARLGDRWDRAGWSRRTGVTERQIREWVVVPERLPTPSDLSPSDP